MSTIIQVLRRRVEEYPTALAYQEPDETGWASWTWSAYWERVTAVAEAFQTAGVGAGDRIAILAGTSLSWEISDRAALAAGAVVVGIDAQATSEQICFILDHSKARAVVTTTKDLGKIDPRALL